MPSDARIPWPPLTRALDDPASPVRIAVDRLLTYGDLRGVQRDYRANVGPIVVSSRGANAGTVGTATDIALRFYIQRRPDVGMAVGAAVNIGSDAMDIAAELAERFECTVTSRRDLRPAGAPTLDPLQVPDREPESIVRASWALALFVEMYRAGPRDDNPLVRYFDSTPVPSVEGVLALADAAAVSEVGSIVELARTELLSALLAASVGAWHVNPIFTGTKWMPADTDLIAGGTLVEVKTNLGERRKADGSRFASLSRETVRQLVGYVLHDVDDTYELDSVAVYDGRYGALTVWPLQDFLDRAAGREVNLAAERDAYQQTLTAGRIVEA